MQRRQFLAGAAGLIAGSLAPRLAMADVPTAFTFDMAPPMDNREKFIAWGVAQRGEDPKYLGERFDRFGAMVRNEDLCERPQQTRLPVDAAREIRAPAESRPRLRPRLPRHRLRRHDFGPAYRRPHDSNIDPKRGEKVLEIGTGSGYQSAYLSHLTDQVYTVEIIKPLAERTRSIYDELIKDGYKEFEVDQEQGRRRLLRLGRGGAVRQDHRHLRHRPRSAAAAAAVEARRDHGHSGRAARRAARLEGGQEAGRTAQMTVARSDIYGGRIVPFVPFTKLEGDQIVGTHNN